MDNEKKYLWMLVVSALLIVLFLFIYAYTSEAKENPYFNLKKRVVSLCFWELNDDFEIKKIPVEIYDGSLEKVLESAMIKMLKGPKCESLYSFIPEGTRLNSLEIKNSVAYLDFTEELQNYGGGSYNVLHIKKQLEETISQFPGIKNYCVTVEGKTEKEGVLQP
jgi:spore germination protein GerM